MKWLKMPTSGHPESLRCILQIESVYDNYVRDCSSKEPSRLANASPASHSRLFRMMPI